MQQKRKKSRLKSRYKVVIIQRVLAQYRKPFYELLFDRLAQANVELVLLHGNYSNSEAKKNDEVEIEWAHKIKNKCIKAGPRELYWQTCLKYIPNANLIIVEQASKLLLNYVLFMSQIFGIKKLCFWGHGKNYQKHNASSMGERIKRFMSRYVHWWFAYNNLSTEFIKSIGYPRDRITSIQNAIDSKSLITAREKVNLVQLENIKKELGIKGNSVCIYTGGMYQEKRLDFLLDACKKIKNSVSDFEMIFIGAGPDDSRIKTASKQFEWIHYTGPKFNEEKVPYFLISKLFLMPGLVGLAVLDTFALETPLVTTDISYHSPEIDYVVDGVTGVIVRQANDSSVYADRVSFLLKNEKARKKLVTGCRTAREKYTIEEMVNRFSEGVIKALHS